MALNVGWRNFYWLNVAILAFAIIAVLVGFPETKWRRPAANEILVATQTPDSPTKDIAVEKQDDSSGSGSGNVNTVAEADLGKSKPAKWQWKLLQPAENPFKSLLVEFLVPWKLLLYPIVIFASLIVAFSSTCYLMVNYVQSEGLAAPPYLFSTQAVGFTNFASLVGALLGLFTAGPASDYVSAAFTKRNKGIREPEMRLVTMIPYVLIMILGNFMVGYGFKNSWNWRVSQASHQTIASLTLTHRSSSSSASHAPASKSQLSPQSPPPTPSTATNPPPAPFSFPSPCTRTYGATEYRNSLLHGC